MKNENKTFLTNLVERTVQIRYTNKYEMRKEACGGPP